MRKTILLGSLGVGLAGCMLVNPADVVGCREFICRVTPKPPVISANGSEVIQPLLCRDEKWTPHSPEGQFEWRTALAYTPSNGQWRHVFYSQPEEQVVLYPNVDALNDKEGAPSCAADCSKFIRLKQINPPGQKFHYEVFYSENGVERQLSHFNVGGAPLAWPRLSADGRVALVRFGQAIAIIDVASGTTDIVSFKDAAAKECASPGVISATVRPRPG